MAVIDGVLLLLVAGGAVYGGLRGLRGALFLLVSFLAAFVGILLLTGPFEYLLLLLSPLDTEAYAGAPAVAAFLLEGEKGLAFLAALLPLFVLILAEGMLITGARLTGRRMSRPSCGAGCRAAGVLTGVLAGIVLVLIAGVQLIRLPWAPGTGWYRESLVFAVLQKLTGQLLPMAAGGQPYV